MARPEQPIATSNPHLEKLARWLRACRQEAGLTHREMAATPESAFSATTFSRATSGRRVPRLRVVEAYARVCRVSVAQARQYWRAARGAEAQRHRPPFGVTDPDHVYTRTQLNQALQGLYYEAGAIPVHELERRAGRHGELPHSTVLRMLADQTLFAQAQLVAFLRVCDVTDNMQWDRWKGAWQRARRNHEMERMGARLAQKYRASARARRRAHSPAVGTADDATRFGRGPRFHPNLYVALANPWPHSSGGEARGGTGLSE